MKTYITSIGTANPEYAYSQSDILSFMLRALSLDLEEERKLRVLYRASGIQRRFSVLPDYQSNTSEHLLYPYHPQLLPSPTVGERMKVYQKEALPLAMRAVESCLAKAVHVGRQQITHLVTVSCTGMYAPGLDIELIERLGLNSHIQRVAIQFMGCYGAFNGLKVADALCKASSSAKVLVVCVELCSLHFQHSKSDDQLLAAALFADGAAAALIENQANADKNLLLKSFWCDVFSEGKTDMAWHIADLGFEMVLSSYVPDLLGKGIQTLVERLLKQTQIQWNDIQLLAIHPGGKRILEEIENALQISKEANYFSYDVLKNFGNMSSATVLFVLEKLLNSLQITDKGKNILSMAFGPGLTVESAIFEIVINQEVSSNQSESYP
ncbi:MAG: type III polyketide synthase [Flammeovirgaceae bacterium]